VPGFLPAVSLKSDAEQCLILSLRKLSAFDASSCNQSHLNNKNRTYRYANKYFVNPKEAFRYDKTYYILNYFVSWNIEWRSARFWLTGKEMSITNVLLASKWSNLDARCDEIGNRKAKNVVHLWSHCRRDCRRQRSIIHTMCVSLSPVFLDTFMSLFISMLLICLIFEWQIKALNI